ncbi:MAG: DUF192 domain-containing protein [Clostridiaceae bacterium]
MEKTILNDVYIADTFKKRFLGYMFQKKPKYDAILIKPCNSIHTFFMKFPIDVIFLNEEMKIVKKIENLQPSKIVFPVKSSVMVMEFKTGSFKNMGNVGDEVLGTVIKYK